MPAIGGDCPQAVRRAHWVGRSSPLQARRPRQSWKATAQNAQHCQMPAAAVQADTKGGGVSLSATHTYAAGPLQTLPALITGFVSAMRAHGGSALQQDSFPFDCAKEMCKKERYMQFHECKRFNVRY